MNVTLRIVEEDDIPSVERAVGGGDAADFMSRCFPRSRTTGAGADDFTRWHLILTGGDVAGTVWTERDSTDSGCCDLGILIFHPESRGRGLGAEAIRLAERDAAVHWAVRLVRLRVRASNARAISCYRRCGYEVTATTTKEVGGESISVLQMEHRLAVGDDVMG